MGGAATSKNEDQPGLTVPRFCSVEQLASLFGFSPHWIYKLNKRGKGPPRLKGVRPYRYDTQSRAFKMWLEEMGIDTDKAEPVVDIARNEYV
jgi:hypothetical protein